MKRSAEFFDWFKQEYKLYPIYKSIKKVSKPAIKITLIINA